MDKDLLKGLKKEGILDQLYLYDEVSSTNDLAKKDPGDRKLFLAEVQTTGRGRLGRNWKSPAETGIWMSYSLKNILSPDNIPGVTIVAALAVAEILEEMMPKEIGISPEIKIKWPNDIVINQKKVCGILTEYVSGIGTGEGSEKEDYIICGIGINVNMSEFPEELADKATSLFMETGVTFLREEIVCKVIKKLTSYYETYGLLKSLDFLKKNYNDMLININEEIVLVGENGDDERKVICVSRGIDDTGALLVEREGKIERIIAGEISVRGLYGYV